MEPQGPWEGGAPNNPYMLLGMEGKRQLRGRSSRMQNNTQCRALLVIAVSRQAPPKTHNTTSRTLCSVA
jgi:hypothetical protein